jgi:CheY-like chemotaxis protein
MKNILIIEDEEQLRKNTVKMIMLTDSFSDVTVEECSNPLDALKKMETFYPDLIITDFLMPFMNGEELIQHVRKLPQYKHTPIILLSAKPDVASFFNDAYIDFLMKPFFYKELVQKIQDNLFIKPTI